MKKTSTFLFVFLLVSSFYSCNKTAEQATSNALPTTKTYADLEKANWLIGNWGNTSAEGTLTEFWVKTNDSVYHGESYFVVGKDTVFSEHIQLEEANGKLAYIVTVPNQNNEKPVRFDMTSINNEWITFENPLHDFPNKIVYHKINNDSLIATIYGTQKGKPATETFAMARHK